MTSKLPDDLPEHDNTLRSGARLAEFEIRDVIGVGGFGIVYRAFDHDLEREVAIKEYMPGQLAGRDATGAITVRARTHLETFGIGMRSFINEARLLARFDHPALLKVYRYWEANGTAYMAMPYYQGSTLSQVVQGLPGPPSQDWLMGIIEPLLGALELLHSQQIYHRDISPDNILLLDDGRPVLLDFGAARRVIGDHTQALTAILKPNYAPIEQYADVPGLKQGPWTDVYALGAVVYACLTGKPPSPAATRAVMDDLVPFTQIGAQLQQHYRLQFDATFLSTWQRSLAVKPMDRVQNIPQLRQLLAGDLSIADDPEQTRILVPVPTIPAVPDGDDDPERTVIRTRPTLPPQRPAAVPPVTRPLSGVPPERQTAPGAAHVKSPITAPAPAQPPAVPPPAARPGGGLRTAGLIAALMLLGAGATYWALQRGADPKPEIAVAPSAPVASAVASAAIPASSPGLAGAEMAASAPVPASAPPLTVVASAPTEPAPDIDPKPPAPTTSAKAPAPPVRVVPRKPAKESASAPSPKPPEEVAPVRPAPGSVASAPPPASAAPAVPAGPPTATAACGKRVFIAMWNCMRDQCVKPQYEAQPDCRSYISQERQKQLDQAAKSR